MLSSTVKLMLELLSVNLYSNTTTHSKTRLKRNTRQIFGLQAQSFHVGQIPQSRDNFKLSTLMQSIWRYK